MASKKLDVQWVLAGSEVADGQKAVVLVRLAGGTECALRMPYGAAPALARGAMLAHQAAAEARRNAGKLDAEEMARAFAPTRYHIEVVAAKHVGLCFWLKDDAPLPLPLSADGARTLAAQLFAAAERISPAKGSAH